MFGCVRWDARDFGHSPVWRVWLTLMGKRTNKIAIGVGHEVRQGKDLFYSIFGSGLEMASCIIIMYGGINLWGWAKRICRCVRVMCEVDFHLINESSRGHGKTVVYLPSRPLAPSSANAPMNALSQNAIAPIPHPSTHSHSPPNPQSDPYTNTPYPPSPANTHPHPPLPRLRSGILLDDILDLLLVRRAVLLEQVERISLRGRLWVRFVEQRLYA